MRHNNTGTTGPLSLNFNYADGDKYLEKVKNDRWKLWLDMGLWDYKEAIRLMVCEPQPCQSIAECVKDFEDGFRNKEFYPDDLYGCFFNQISNTSSKIYTVFALYKAEAWSQYGFPNDDYPERIVPATFIEWALSKQEIEVPQELADWYNTHKPQRKATPTVARTATPTAGKRRDEVTQKEAAQRLGVSERTIHNWDKGIGTPDGYKGRGKLTSFLIFAEDYETTRRLKEDARQKNKAVAAGDMSKYADIAASEAD